ncbi:hypothetical protein T439DRAFT_70390 [Meredithblackwellia eburnea MCA 4105]
MNTLTMNVGSSPLQTAACARCRQTRRACKAAPGSTAKFPCGNCLKRNIRLYFASISHPWAVERLNTSYSYSCSGQGLDGRSFRRKSQVKTKNQKNEYSVVPHRLRVEGPSSAGWRLLEIKMGSALHYHLIQMGLATSLGVQRLGFTDSATVTDLLARVGRISAISPLKDIVLARIQLRGLCYSSHSSIIRSQQPRPFLGFADSSASSNVVLGILRQPFRSQIQSRVYELSEHVKLDQTDPEASVEALAMLVEAFAAAAPADGVETRPDRCILRLGLRLIRDPQVQAKPECISNIKSYLQDQVRTEMLGALSTGQTSLVYACLVSFLFLPYSRFTRVTFVPLHLSVLLLPYLKRSSGASHTLWIFELWNQGYCHPRNGIQFRPLKPLTAQCNCSSTPPFKQWFNFSISLFKSLLFRLDGMCSTPLLKRRERSTTCATSYSVPTAPSLNRPPK